MEASPSSLAVPASAALAGGVGLVMLAGPALPVAWGLLPAALALVLAVVVGRWRAGAGDRDRAEDPGSLAPRGIRVVLVVLVVLSAIVAVAVAVRVIAALCVASPPTIAALLVLCVGGVMLVRPRGGLAGGLAVVLAAVVMAAAIGVARFEAAGPGARGFAHSGPILGIHPFQSTAIMIDGFGPFDIPVNDYVEPDGSRGYKPAELAEALERDLAAIAGQQFADGPARAYQAFAGARVEAVELPAIQERLDRTVVPGTNEPRIVVWSGTVGPGSRVEFVCPGSRNDPRPRTPDDVMERMCSDKYSSEASAGLGLTGRWTGYAEGRGVARLGLAGALGWPGGDDRFGAATRLWEQRLWAWIALLLLVPVVLWRDGARGLARAAAGLCGVAAAGLLAMFVWTWPLVQVGWTERAAPWSTPWRLTQWSPVLVVALIMSVGRRAAAVPAGIVALATWALAGALAATVWAVPAAADPVALARGLGGVMVRAGIDLAAAEAIAASVIVAAMLGLLAAVLGPGLGLADRVVGGTKHRWFGVGVLVAAGLLVLSRKTLGGAALLMPALALALAAGTGVRALRPGPGRRLRAVDHLLAVGVLVWAAAEAWADRSNPFMAAALLVGVIAGLASLAALAGPRRVRSGQDAGVAPQA